MAVPDRLLPCAAVLDRWHGTHTQALTDITLVKKGKMPMTAHHPNIPPQIVAQKLDEGYSIVRNSTAAQQHMYTPLHISVDAL